MLTALLYLLIFSHALESHVQVYPGVGYTAFLVPGLAMMSLLQNAFANSSSSLIQSKITGNIIFVLLPPLSAAGDFPGLRAGRGGARPGGRRWACCWSPLWFADVPLQHPLWVLAFALLGGGILGALGIIAGHLGRQVRPARGVPELHHHAAHVSVRRVLFDPFAAAVLAGASHLNPFFYMVDGFRYGFFGVGDVSP